MRLIDADALNARMYHDAFETDTDMQKWDSGCWIRYKMFENAIAEAPTVEERKKGKWKYTVTYYPYCSECNWIPEGYETWVENYNYCPYCGAYMRGEEYE